MPGTSGGLDLSLNDRASREEKEVCLGSESLSMTKMSVVLNTSHLLPDVNSNGRQNLNISYSLRTRLSFVDIILQFIYRRVRSEKSRSMT